MRIRVSDGWNQGAVVVVLAGVLGWSSVAGAQANKVPDAQVEANVLKALAGAPDLANQSITTTTVYGVVTLSGAVQTEALRVEAETLTSRAGGVQKVVDELTLGAAASVAPAQGGAAMPDAQPSQPMLQSDGTMAPAQLQGNAQMQAPMQAPMGAGAPNAGGPQGSPQQTYPGGYGPDSANTPAYGPGAPEYRQPYGGQAATGQAANGQPQPGYGAPPQGYPQAGYPAQGYPQQGYPQQPYNGAAQPQTWGGQQAGEMVTIPSGALVRIRINQAVDSARAKPGDRFEGIVVNDVVGGGAVAIPRGAMVQGAVVDAKKSGALAGRGELSLQLTQITLGGKAYPIVSDLWAHNGADKAVQSVNSTVIGGGVGALIGAVAGGGAGAAIGAGVGGALGLGSSAASHTGQVFVPAEGMLTFHLAQPATIATVSQQEMDRLAQGVPGISQQGLQRRYPPYYGPGYYRPNYPYPY